jgi:type I restriction enzyme S subunit
MSDSGTKQGASGEDGVCMVGFETAPFCSPDELLQGLTYTPENVKDYGLLVLRSSNIKNGHLVFDDTVYVDRKVDSDHLVHKGDIIICVRNGSSALIGKCAIAERDYNATWGAFMACVRSDHNEFLYQVFQSDIIQKQIHGKSNATINQITNRDFRELTIPLPPLPEQRRIAEALSDTDDYISALEKLIAKKRDIKKGAMQELLTGKRRLPGFEGEWMEKKIMDFPADVVSGGTPSTFISAYWGGSIPWMNSGELNLKHVYVVEGRITQLGLENSSTTLVPSNSVLVGLAGQGKTRGTVAMNFIDLCTNQSIAAVLPNPSVYCSEYLYQNLDSRYEELRELSTGDRGRGGLNLTILRNLTVPFPTLAEQSAIAAILSDMDAEIDALTVKLNKIRNIKQGMMSELLTGGIRLVEQEIPAEAVAASKVVEFPKQEVAKQPAKGHNQHFDDAVMMAGIVNAFYSDKYVLGRKKVQKLMYLLRRYQNASTSGFKEKAAGPYDEHLRYTIEPLAIRNKYIVTKSSQKGTSFFKGDKIAQAVGYINKWDEVQNIQWLRNHFLTKTVDDLELITTVDRAMCALIKTKTAISMVTIKQYIHDSEEWKAKLKREIFSDFNIARAITWSTELFGTELRSP